MSAEFAKAMAKLNDERDEQAHAAMSYPKSDPFEHGVQVGLYRGLQKAQELLKQMLEEEKEQ